MPDRQSGQPPFVFTHCPDLHQLPRAALAQEPRLHGGFAVDDRPGYGHLYYGMPGCGLLRISPDLSAQDMLELPPDLLEANFHSAKIGTVDGAPRLILPSNDRGLVALVTLDGDVDRLLTKPEFAEYAAAEATYKPTDTVLDGSRLLIADGYAANLISVYDLAHGSWHSHFGGKTDDPTARGRFGTAHGMNFSPVSGRLTIADRPHARFQELTHAGDFVASHRLPAGSKPCGISFANHGGQWTAAVGSLDDPTPGRPAPIYILDAMTFEVVSTIRPKEELGVEAADHIHNVVWHTHAGQTFLVCQSWNPGHFFVLALV